MNINHMKEFKNFLWLEEDYRDLLSNCFRLKISPLFKSKSHFASIMDVSPPYISKILSKRAHLNLEQAELITRELDLSELEKLAFLDRFSLSRTNSPQLQELLKKRLSEYFDKSHREISYRTQPKNSEPRPLPVIKIEALLRDGVSRTVSQISHSLEMNEEKVKFFLESIASQKELNIIKEDGVVSYQLIIENENPYQTVFLNPSSKSLFDHSMQLRRLAQHSLEKNFPIHIVDKSDHYFSGSYMLYADSKKIDNLKNLFSRFRRDIEEICIAPVEGKGKITGITFDFFDMADL